MPTLSQESVSQAALLASGPPNWLLVVHLCSTFALVGLIWVVQLVHYPAFAYVDPARWHQFHGMHTSQITLMVAPLMLIEVATAAALLWYGLAQPAYTAKLTLLLIATLLLIIVWASTFFVQVPLHNALAAGPDQSRIARLVSTNWVRTIAWSARAIIILYMAVAPTWHGHPGRV
jgi:hypothetical protein